jgi:hypothetical protein
MKTLQWLRNSKGEFEQVGVVDPKVKWVYIEVLDPVGLWKRIARAEYEGKEAFTIITSAIEKKQTGKWHGYRMVPCEVQTRRVKKDHTAEDPDRPRIAPRGKKKPLDDDDDQLDFAIRVKREQGKKDEPQTEEEENVQMVKKSDKKAPTETEVKEKVLGYFRKETAIGDLAEALLDEKPHKLSTLMEKIKKTYKVNPEFRLTIFKKESKARNLCGIIVDRDADTIQIKIGKGQPIPSKKPVATKVAATAPAPKAKQIAKAEDEDSSAVAKLVRKVLATDGQWTKNKVVDAIRKDHSIEPKMVQAAIAAEIRGGGVTEEEGLLSLSAS